MRPRRTLSATIVAVAALALTGCAGAEPAAAGTPVVVASTNVYGSIAMAVAGDRAAVTSVVTDPAADPHSYESTPADAAKISGAALVIYNGGGYDDWMAKIVESAGGQRTVINVTELSGLRPATPAAEGEGEFNEHLWYSLPTVQKVATQIATTLGAADPAHQAQFAANAAAFNEKVGGMIDKATAIGAAAPGARVAVTEPVPGYLIETAGLTNATPDEFAEAIEEDTDPPAAVLQETLALFTGADPVRILILNAQTQTPTTDQVRRGAEAARIPVVEMTETLPADQPEYVAWMGAQIGSLATAMTKPGV